MAQQLRGNLLGRRQVKGARKWLEGFKGLAHELRAVCKGAPLFTRLGKTNQRKRLRQSGINKGAATKEQRQRSTTKVKRKVKTNGCQELLDITGDGFGRLRLRRLGQREGFNHRLLKAGSGFIGKGRTLGRPEFA